MVSQFTISWVHLYLSRIIINILSYSDPSGLIQEMQKICKIILVQNTHIFVRTATEVMTAMEAMMMFFFRKRLTVHHRAEEWVWEKSVILYGVGRNGELEEVIVGPGQAKGKDLPSHKTM